MFFFSVCIDYPSKAVQTHEKDSKLLQKKTTHVVAGGTGVKNVLVNFRSAVITANTRSKTKTKLTQTYQPQRKNFPQRLMAFSILLFHGSCPRKKGYRLQKHKGREK